MLLTRFDHAESGVSLWFEDDGRVAYAYLRRGDALVADVWVYNRAESPNVPEWKDGRRPPFLNPSECVVDKLPFLLPDSDEDVGVRWIVEPERPVGAAVLLGGVVAAFIHEGDKPGRAVGASRDSPIARQLVR